MQSRIKTLERCLKRSLTPLDRLYIQIIIDDLWILHEFHQ